ncbi:MAG: MBL fold metallo-hydrolase [Deltaproteobacteria bacterium]|nr:MBL fold metallo-hydrolase [Deltaproteobacteria bacterium]
MSVRIYAIPLGSSQCYLIQDRGAILVDAGPPKKLRRFARALSDIPIEPSRIRLIVITHAHWDHIGSAKEIRDFTAAPLAAHQAEKRCVEEALKPLPPGVTRWARAVGRVMTVAVPLIRVHAATVDLEIGPEGMALDDFGVKGRIIHTPGHSSGSVSVLLDTGDAFVGDLAMNRFPLRLGPGFPAFAEDMVKVKESWKVLLERGVKRIYPGHGPPFMADKIRRAMKF